MKASCTVFEQDKFLPELFLRHISARQTLLLEQMVFIVLMIETAMP